MRLSLLPMKKWTSAIHSRGRNEWSRDKHTLRDEAGCFITAVLLLLFHCCRFVVGTLRRQPFRRRYTSLPAISSQVHFIASHFVAETLHCLPLHCGDTSLPAVLSQGHFIAGTRTKLWNSPELEDNVTYSVQIVHIHCSYMLNYLILFMY